MALPNTYKALVIQQLTPKFRNAVSEVIMKMKKPEPNEITIKNRYVAINATDPNVTAGRYGGVIGTGVGLEGIGEVVDVGANVKNFKIGQPVAYLDTGAFSEYHTVLSKAAFPVPEVKPEYMSLVLSGLTASIGLDKVGEIKKGDNVLITAAAGALGQIAVQWCKAAGCHVIGITSTSEKEKILKDLGCDDIINYKEQNLRSVLKDKYPEGLDVIWETIGGEVFDTLFSRLGYLGKMVLVGSISGYSDERSPTPKVGTPNIPGQLLMKSASLRGFMIFRYQHFYSQYYQKLSAMHQTGSLKLAVDDGSTAEGGRLVGLDGCIRGVEYLHSGKSSGKVYVSIQ